MNLQMLQELEAELLEQGYSKSYARRLAGELLDHAIESAQNSSAQMDTVNADNIGACIGSTKVIVNAVNQFQELDPVPRKYPFLCFVAVPVIALNLLILVVLNLLYSWLPDSSGAYKVWAAQSWNFLYYGLLALGPVAAVVVSRRYRVPQVYVLLSVAVLSISSLFGTVVATCSQSSSTFVHSEWGIRWQQLILPGLSTIMAGVVSFLMTKMKRRRRASFGVRGLFNQFDAKIAIGYSVIFVAMLMGSQILIDWSLDSLRSHPVDNLVTSFNSDTHRVGRAFEVLRSGSIELDPAKQHQIDILIADLDRKVSENFERLQNCESDRQRNLADEELRSASIQAFQAASKHLTMDQLDKIRLESLKRAGWMALFDDEVRDTLELSAFQFERFKDEYLASIKRQQKLLANWRKASAEGKKQIEQDINDNRLFQKSKFASILSTQQSTAFRRYLHDGEPTQSDFTVMQ